MEYLHVLFFYGVSKIHHEKCPGKTERMRKKNCKGMFASESSSKVSAPSRAVQKRVIEARARIRAGNPSGVFERHFASGNHTAAVLKTTPSDWWSLS